MKITFLGTGTSQGIPIIGCTHPVCLSEDAKDKRLRSSVAIAIEGKILVIDCGPDFRYQMLRSGIQQLDALLFTHEHADHTAGLDDIRPFYFKQGNIQMYMHQRVQQSLERRFNYILSDEDKYPGAPAVDIHTITNTEFEAAGIPILPINVFHYKLQVFGFRIKDFVYLTDVKTIPEEEFTKLKDIKVLVVNALRIEPHISHYNLEEALALVERLKPERTYFTHISHLLGFHEEVSKKLPKNVFLAYDQLTIEL